MALFLYDNGVFRRHTGANIPDDWFSEEHFAQRELLEAGWRALFPPAAAYPRGTHLGPVHAATHANVLVDPATATQITHLGFVAGELSLRCARQGSP